MNTANITGRAAGIYGIGATAPRPVRTAAQESRQECVSAFVLAVRDAFRGAGQDGGTYIVGNGGGYVVGGYGNAVVIRAHSYPWEATAAAVEFATRYPVGDGYGVGYWRCPDTDRVWLDAVCAFHDYAEALNAARANGERAIYRASDGECIPVN